MEALLPPRLQLLTRMVTVGYPASGGLHTRRGSSRGHDLRRLKWAFVDVMELAKRNGARYVHSALKA